MTYTGLKDTTYTLSPKPISFGGEGAIYEVAGTALVAKIYHEDLVSKELESKLIVMSSNLPDERVLTQVAWPQDVIYRDGKFRGFVMTRLKINAELGEVYKYPNKINMTTKQRLIVAQNICAVILSVHKSGYVFGDFNPRNIGLDKGIGRVAFLDTDSYHVYDDNANKTYRCVVCAPGYAAPELLEKCSKHLVKNPQDKVAAYAKTPLATFTKETDNFALAIHIFKLLFNGFSPYGGVRQVSVASEAAPGKGDIAVRRDNYCFKPGNKHESEAVPALMSYPIEIRELLNRAFVGGRANPGLRPDAAEWHSALSILEKSLVQCKRNKLHQYDKSNEFCPLCDADRRYARANKTDVHHPIVTSNLKTKPNINPIGATPTAQNPVTVPPPIYAANGRPHIDRYGPNDTNGVTAVVPPPIISDGVGISRTAVASGSKSKVPLQGGFGLPNKLLFVLNIFVFLAMLALGPLGGTLMPREYPMLTFVAVLVSGLCSAIVFVITPKSKSRLIFGIGLLLVLIALAALIVGVIMLIMQ